MAIRRSARPQNKLQSRFASSSSSDAAQQKAKQALEGAQKGLAQAAEVAKKFGGSAGERAGKLLGCELVFSYFLCVVFILFSYNNFFLVFFLLPSVWGEFGIRITFLEY